MIEEKKEPVMEVENLSDELSVDLSQSDSDEEEEALREESKDQVPRLSGVSELVKFFEQRRS